MPDVNLDLIRGRQLVLPLTNKSGAQRTEGEVVIADVTTDDSFTRTTAVGNDLVIGVVAETIANNAEGRIICGGYVPTMEVSAATSRGDYLKTSATAGKADPTATMDVGVFAIALSSTGGAGTVSAYLFGVDSGAAGANHDILDGAVHPDSVADAVTRGSLIYGNSTPKWDELVVGAAGRVLTSDGTDISWAVPGGGGGLDEDQYGNNLVRNSPGQIVVDGAEPQWWDDVANATITDEDTAGEGIADKHERCFKVVTTADDVYGYQTLTFADEELLDAGVTVVSFGCWVYSAGAGEASIGIFGTNLGLQESAQHTGGASWEWLEVENKTLNGADTSIEIRLIVDTATAYFTMPMLVVNGTTQPWKPRGTGFVAISRVTALDLANIGDIAWTDLDLTAHTHNLCTAVQVQLMAYEDDGINVSSFKVGHSDDIVGADFDIVFLPVYVKGFRWNSLTVDMISLDDGQNLRYSVAEADADSDMDVRVNVCGYWRWA